MGYIFESEGTTIWSPSSRVGQQFLDQVRSLERLAGNASGIGELGPDEVQVDFNVLRDFLQTLPDPGKVNLQHPSLNLLLKGVIVHLLKFLSFSSLRYDFTAQYPDEWLAEVRDMRWVR